MKRFLIAFGLALFLSAEANAYDLTWTPGQGGGVVEEFRIYRQKPGEANFKLIGKVGATTTNFSDPDRTPNTCYRVTAANFAGESAPLEGCALIPPAVTVIILR
jgi:hypothetical protein